MNKNLKPQLSSTHDNWSTPKKLIKLLEKDFGKFDFDPCPLRETFEENALFIDWKGNVFINPPYSNVAEFLNKGLIELKKGNATQLIFLIIPRTSTKYWEKYIMTYATEIYFINKRLKFGNSKSSAPFPSCIVQFNNLNIKDNVPCKIFDFRIREFLEGKNEF